MNSYEAVVKSIISQQELIIGPVAVQEANKVPGLKVTLDGKSITITGDGKDVLANLVNQYASLFGRVSVEVCKEALLSSGQAIDHEQLPEILK